MYPYPTKYSVVFSHSNKWITCIYLDIAPLLNDPLGVAPIIQAPLSSATTGYPPLSDDTQPVLSPTVSPLLGSWHVSSFSYQWAIHLYDDSSGTANLIGNLSGSLLSPTSV